MFPLLLLLVVLRQSVGRILLQRGDADRIFQYEQGGYTDYRVSDQVDLDSQSDQPNSSHLVQRESLIGIVIRVRVFICNRSSHILWETRHHQYPNDVRQGRGGDGCCACQSSALRQRRPLPSVYSQTVRPSVRNGVSRNCPNNLICGLPKKKENLSGL